MKVICKGYKTCKDRENCEHSIEHEIIDIFGPFEQNCILEATKGEFAHINENCICNLKNVRKEKLTKLNEISTM
jgi:hypothetical protein